MQENISEIWKGMQLEALWLELAKQNPNKSQEELTNEFLFLLKVFLDSNRIKFQVQVQFHKSFESKHYKNSFFQFFINLINVYKSSLKRNQPYTVGYTYWVSEPEIILEQIRKWLLTKSNTNLSEKSWIFYELPFITWFDSDGNKIDQ